MKNFAATLVILLCVPSIAQPLSFGSMQLEDRIYLSAGENYTTKIYFFNLYETTAHIRANVSIAPEGWFVEIFPPPHEEVMEMDGLKVKFEENLHVDPRSGEPILIEGIGSVPSENLSVKIGVPPGTKPGEYTVRIDCSANYFGQQAMVAMKQERGFEYKVIVGGGGKSKSIVISSTLHDLPIDFGIVRPGLVEQRAIGGFPMRIRIDLSNVPTTISIRGTDFTCMNESFPAESVRYSNRSDGPRVELANEYLVAPFQDWIVPETSSGEVREVYFWISIPRGQKPGKYSSTFSIEVNPVDVEPMEIPEREIVVVTPTPTPAGFELAIALASLLSAPAVRRR